MIFICEKNKLQDGIFVTQKAITGKTPMPVLEGIYIKADNTGLTLIGSDVDISIETKLEANVIEEGSVVIEAKMFGEIIRKLPDSDIKIELIDDGMLQITCQKSVFNVVCMNANDYPELPPIEEEQKISIPQNILKNMIKSTSFAVAQDETRPILQGILFEIQDKKLSLVALDGFRLAIKSEYIDYDSDIKVVIPGKTLVEVSKILEDSEDLVNITFTKNHILFDLNKTKIISRLLEGEFFDYKSFPEEHKTTINVNRQQLQNGIERASLMGKEGNTNLVKFEANEDTLVITSNSQLGKVREEVNIILQGDPIEVAFNSRYLLDVLKNMEQEEIKLYLASSINPCVIKAQNTDSYKYLVLPVRLVK